MTVPFSVVTNHVDVRNSRGGIAVAGILSQQKLPSGEKEADKIRADYERTLGERPWKQCQCNICQAIGINVIIFRGAERNRRRGFHNIQVLYNRLQHTLSLRSEELS